MCGITGFWKPRGLDDGAAAVLERMMGLLHHRGPDGQGVHLDRALGLAMGHTRLSIIDLQTGAQPLFGPGKKLVMTVNGEFYDYKPHRAELACLGERFATKSDSEIALHLYRLLGLPFVERLRGEFAFALFDQEERQLLLVRDRFGIKPLYYRLSDSGLLYGSEIKAILAHPETPRRLCPQAALNQMMHTMVPGTTAFEGIRALQPGHMLIVRDKEGRLAAEEVAYWDFVYPRQKEHDSDPDAESYVDEVRDRLIDAVRVRLEADVPVGCYLSGGIDSCSILGLATALQQSPVKAYTISFDHSDYDESAIAIEMARSARADQEILKLAAADLYGDSYVRTVWHAERTFYNTLGVAKWHMSRRVRASGFKVVVTGEGSDEMFAGYPFFKRDFFLHGSQDETAGLAALDASNRVFKGAILAEESVSHPAMDRLCGFTPSWIQPWILTLRRARPLFSDAVLAELGDYDPVAAIAKAIDPAPLEDRHPLDRAQYTWIKTMLEGQILTWGGDRVDMANSMESRPAFLDHELADLARQIPPGVRIRGGIEKWVLREAMKGVLPEVLYKREKFAFMAPPSHTDTRKQAALRALAETYLCRQRIEEAGLFDAQRVAAFVDGALGTAEPVEGARNDILLNHLLGLQILHQQMVADIPRNLGQ